MTFLFLSIVRRELDRRRRQNTQYIRVYTYPLAARSGRFANALQQPAGVPFALSLSGVPKGSCPCVFREGKGGRLKFQKKREPRGSKPMGAT